MKTFESSSIAALGLFLACAGTVQAAAIVFDDTSPDVLVGESFFLTIQGASVPELAGGMIDLGYDDSVVEIVGVTIDPYWDFFPESGAKTAAGTWTGIGFDTFVNDPASGNFDIATVEFVGLAAGSANIGLLGSSEFFSATQQVFPTLGSSTVSVSAVPVPAAAWLFLSGLAGLGLIGKRKKCAHSA